MLFLANGQLEGLIWLVVIVLWGLGQLLNAIKKSQEKDEHDPTSQSPAQPQSRGAGNEPESLQDFLESLAGGSPESAASNQSEGAGAESRPSSARQKEHSAKQARIRQTAPQRSKSAKSKSGQSESMAKMEVRKRMFRSRDVSSSTIKSFKLPSVKLPRTVNLMSGPKQRKPSQYNLNLDDKAAMKRAILNRYILGAPKALENDPIIEEIFER